MNAQREQSGHTPVEAPGPSEMHDPLVRRDMQKAAVWFGLAISIAFLVLLAQPILLILGALVITSMLDGGTRLLGRILPIGRGWRLTVIILRSQEHTSELQSLMRNSYAVFCLKKKNKKKDKSTIK